MKKRDEPYQSYFILDSRHEAYEEAVEFISTTTNKHRSYNVTTVIRDVPDDPYVKVLVGILTDRDRKGKILDRANLGIGVFKDEYSSENYRDRIFDLLKEYERT